MELFHQWGVIFILPDNGDIILNPQQLSNVFREVITCHKSKKERNEIFEEGILNHNEINVIWKDYDSELHNQFLLLLQRSELCYEIFNDVEDNNNSNKIGKSLIPCLLRDKQELKISQPLIRFDDEDLIREVLKSVYNNNKINLNEITINNKVKGCIRIGFDVLLSNLFPKLMVRLHSITVPSSSFRNCVMVEFPELNKDLKVIGKSLCCIVEMKDKDSILFIPFGESYKSTSISIQSLESLLEDSFIGIEVNKLLIEVLLDHKIYRGKEILYNLKEENKEDLSLSFEYLSPIFPELNYSINQQINNNNNNNNNIDEKRF